MASNMTLKTLRNLAPVQDRGDPALTPTTHDNSPPTPVRLLPRTIAELRAMSGDFAEAAVTDATWGAITSWLDQVYPATDSLRHPWALANNAVFIARQQDRYLLGWLRHDGGKPVPPVLTGLSADYIREMKVVARDTLFDWQAAGTPNLDAKRIGSTYQYLISCPAFRAHQGN